MAGSSMDQDRRLLSRSSNPRNVLLGRNPAAGQADSRGGRKNGIGRGGRPPAASQERERRPTGVGKRRPLDSPL